MATRSEPALKDCSEWTANAFKSSQVFTSTRNEYANDNSLFTRTFSNALLKNPNSCISIETIVFYVNQAMVDQGKQRPMFGKIAGLEDEGGTFIFVKSIGN
jgi:hypothetical protein